MSDPVQIALITTFGTVLIALVNRERKKNKALKAELASAAANNATLAGQVNDMSKGFVMTLQQFNDLNAIAIKLLHRTRADRFLILTALNGQKDFRVASAIFEHHEKNRDTRVSIGAVGRYVGFEFDHHYREMLKTIEREGSIFYEVANMPECDLKHIYETESVTASQIVFLSRLPIDERNDRIFYMSIATHHQGGFNRSERALIKAYQSALKTVIGEIMVG